MKELRILLRFLKIAIEKYNNYKVEYLYSLILVIPILLPALMWYLIVGDGEIAGWNFNKLLSLSIFYGIFLSFLDIIGFWNVWVWIEREERTLLTLILTKPINPLIYVYGMNMFPGGIVKLIIFLMILYSMILTHNFHVSLEFLIITFFSFVSVFLFLSSIIAIMLSYDKSATPLMYIIWNFLRLGDMPISSIGGGAGAILTYIIPVAFTAVVPAKALETGDYSMLLSSIIMTIIMFVVLKMSLKHSLKRFEAVGG